MGKETLANDRVAVAEGVRGRPRTVTLYLIGAIGLGVTAIPGGATVVIDPSGESMGLLAWFEGTPFSEYFVPGRIHFGVLGIGSLVVTGAGIRNHPEPIRRRPHSVLHSSA